MYISVKVFQATCHRGDYDTYDPMQHRWHCFPWEGNFQQQKFLRTSKAMKQRLRSFTKTLQLHKLTTAAVCQRPTWWRRATRWEGFRESETSGWVPTSRNSHQSDVSQPQAEATRAHRPCKPPASVRIFIGASCHAVYVCATDKIKNNFFDHHAKLFTHACCSFCPPSPPLEEPPPPPSLVVFSMRLWIYGSASLRAFAVKWAICENKCHAGSVYSVRSNQNAECIFSAHPLNTKRDEWRISSRRRQNVCVSLWEKACLVTMRLTDEETRSKSWFSSK